MGAARRDPRRGEIPVRSASCSSVVRPTWGSSVEYRLALEQQFLQRVQKEIEEETLLRKESVSQTLWLFSLTDQDSYKSYITRLIENDLQLALFIHQFVNHSRTTTMYNKCDVLCPQNWLTLPSSSQALYRLRRLFYALHQKPSRAHSAALKD